MVTGGTSMGNLGAPFGVVRFSSAQLFYAQIAQRLFISNLFLNFVFYYVSPFKFWCSGDGDRARFPCSISWMTRKALPRYGTFCTWIPGWMFLLYVFCTFEDDNTSSAVATTAIMFLGISMFMFGFITCVLTPIKEDVAMGGQDKVHGIAASIYIMYHWLVNEWVLGVDCFRGENVYCLTFSVKTIICCLCQFLRADDNRKARMLYERLNMMFQGRIPKFQQFVMVIEYAFQFTENCLFLAFLLGMTSGRAVVD
eukprot:TRINITY_DN27802_c0_g1_i1.p1 TRINITY_DN27802_c0_g1~~TRINITY_DN27802_c0_g1_i1.p1  ORF type:complete len:267 (-),score=24.23 TRINITY_DN27802_c0_g1_i1:160-921(-)